MTREGYVQSSIRLPTVLHEASKVCAESSGMTLQGFLSYSIAGAVRNWTHPVTGEKVGVKAMEKSLEKKRIAAIRSVYLCCRPKCCRDGKPYAKIGSCSIKECEEFRSEWIRKDRL